MSYGFPVEVTGPVNAVTLDLPEDVGYVAAADSAKPALKIYGPVPSGTEPDDQSAWSELPEILPINRSWEGSVVYFELDGSLAEGTYRVVVFPSRMRPAESDSYVLVDEDGYEWDGWTLTIVDEERILNPTDPSGEDEDLPLPDLPGESPYAPFPSATTTTQVTIKLDGNEVPSGSSELSGEVLRVEVPKGSEVRLKIEGVLGPVNSLYERHLAATIVTGSETTDAWHFASAGPIDGPGGTEYSWAVYYGTDTEGRLPITAEGGLVYGTPTIRKPSATDPLIDRTSADLVYATNTYEVTRFEVTPNSRGSAFDNVGEITLETRPVVLPVDIQDDTNTPDTNPRVLDELGAPGALYQDWRDAFDGTEKLAAYDLPLGCKLRVFVDGVERWWGQTRLLPLLITPGRWAASGGPNADNLTELARIRFLIYQASYRALRLWGCRLPSYVPATMEEFVLTYLQGYGTPGAFYEDGVVGSVSVKVGDSSYSSQSDYTLKRRLQSLEAMLQACELNPPLFPEEYMGAETAYLASEARPTHYPFPHGDTTSTKYAPLESQYEGTKRGPGSSSREWYDPPQHSRLR